MVTTPFEGSEALNVDGKALMSSTYFRVGGENKLKMNNTVQKNDKKRMSKSKLKSPKGLK